MFKYSLPAPFSGDQATAPTGRFSTGRFLRAADCNERMEMERRENLDFQRLRGSGPARPASLAQEAKLRKDPLSVATLLEGVLYEDRGWQKRQRGTGLKRTYFLTMERR
jgi:hypothetical protein